MNVIKTICLISLINLISLMPILANTTPNTTLLGTWKTIDDISGKPKAIIQIEQNKDQTITGRIIKLFSQNDKNPANLCLECQGDKKNQPIIGMIIMERLKQSKENQNIWTNGQILDPQNGKTYHCNIQLSENGQQLNVRGYIGLPVFGRTQTWIKD